MGNDIDKGGQARVQGSGGQDSPKPHGDKLGHGRTGAVAASPTGVEGDSPKRQGDKLEHAAKEAAKR